MKPGLLIGPYARQVTSGGKLKFWVAFRRTGQLRRYEVSIGANGSFQHRLRPWDYPPGTKYASNFLQYLIPDDLSRFPSATIARAAEIPAALPHLLSDDDLADVTRLKIFGLPPATSGTSETPR